MLGRGSSNSWQVSDISSINESDCEALIASSADEQESDAESTVNKNYLLVLIRQVWMLQMCRNKP